nr:MAG TPA: hypothetical protein [Microviridae sp.]
MSFGITYTRCRPTPGSWTLCRGQLLSDTETTTHRRSAKVDGLRTNSTFPKNLLGGATRHFATAGHDYSFFLKKVKRFQTAVTNEVTSESILSSII